MFLETKTIGFIVFTFPPSDFPQIRITYEQNAQVIQVSLRASRYNKGGCRIQGSCRIMLFKVFPGIATAGLDSSPCLAICQPPGIGSGSVKTVRVYRYQDCFREIRTMDGKRQRDFLVGASNSPGIAV